nr:MAG TPA: baseplate protein [Caudoviricetes sp.]
MPNNKNDTALKGNNDIYSKASNFNGLQFLINNSKKEIATALPVKVVGVQKGEGVVGYVDVLPLVTLVSASDEVVEPVNLYHLPYSRIQGGKAALIIDPVEGDKGLAVFAQSDCSTVTAETTEPQQPGSKRTHSQSDGFYIGGFLNQAPTCFLELKQDNTAVLHATGGIQIDGNINVNGSIKTTGDVVAGSISLQGHVHNGVETGGGTTGKPQ